ncbi:MAG: CoB--CoM heterodisulfide reductase iron-sulfur subunit B family protein [Desulfomonile sp.]|nr:CoB--CoM heterodisulfide reductase iron-sulfur subunit B family protein [Desulfomonile sp.]
MRINYYPGCTLHGSARDYHESIGAVFTALGVRLVELEDWNCCGASSAHVVHPDAAVQLPARNLLIAADTGGPVLAPCAACFHRLKVCQAHLKNHPGDHPSASAVATVEVLHVNHLLVRRDVLQSIRANIRVPLSGLRTVPYYGCLTVRPPAAMGHERPEDPREMDIVLEALGAELIPWSYKTDCCGGSLAMTRPDVVRRLSGDLFEAAREAGGEIIVTDCPMCQANLDTRQREIERERHTILGMPVLYITELVALAMGLTETRYWWRKHLVDPTPLLKSKGIAV